ncbi:MAG: amino acid ABC transporter substrate-binding protein [Colwellia sp.]|nr:amino acid ABC transporter substrate-binding protein [Colwellia sp.]
MTEFLHLEPELIVPNAPRRDGVQLPSWFHGLNNPSPTSDLCILLSDSQGENIEDLLLAWSLNMVDRRGIRVIVADDQRDPDACVEMLSHMLENDCRPDVVIGHFSSPVARRAATIYARNDIPFFAPGSSADDLAVNPKAPTFQMFGQDSGQISALSGALLGEPAAVACGQPGNAGAGLLTLLNAAAACPISAYSYISEVQPQALRGQPLVLMGSKEYVADALTQIDPASRPSVLYISDDSLGSRAVRQAAAPLRCPAFVAALKRHSDRNFLLGFDVKSIEHDATRVLGRAPGPYFLSAWAAIYLATSACRKGHLRPAEMLRYLQRQNWNTPFGTLQFGATGRAEGFIWELRNLT